MKRSIGMVLLTVCGALVLSGCGATKAESDPYASARYKTQNKQLRTQPWGQQEKWEQGGIMGGFQDPRYQQY